SWTGWRRAGSLMAGTLPQPFAARKMAAVPNGTALAALPGTGGKAQRERRVDREQRKPAELLLEAGPQAPGRDPVIDDARQHRSGCSRRETARQRPLTDHRREQLLVNGSPADGHEMMNPVAHGHLAPRRMAPMRHTLAPEPLAGCAVRSRSCPAFETPARTEGNRGKYACHRAAHERTGGRFFPGQSGRRMAPHTIHLTGYSDPWSSS